MTDVYIAEGHGRRPDGSFDPGASDGIHSEQRDSKPVAEAATRILRSAGLTVFSEAEEMDDPNYRGTTARANDMGVECVVSFHYDWLGAPPGAFAIATSDAGRELGWLIEQAVADAGFDIRDYPDDRDGLYLLDNTTMPAVIFECGRIGHEDIDETHEQRAMGEAAGLGILDWLGVDMPTEEQVRNIVKEELAEFFGTAYTAEVDGKDRRYIKGVIDSTWHPGISGTGIRAEEALAQIHSMLEEIFADGVPVEDLEISLTGTARS